MILRDHAGEGLVLESLIVSEHGEVQLRDKRVPVTVSIGETLGAYHLGVHDGQNEKELTEIGYHVRDFVVLNPMEGKVTDAREHHRKTGVLRSRGGGGGLFGLVVLGLASGGFVLDGRSLVSRRSGNNRRA